MICDVDQKYDGDVSKALQDMKDRIIRESSEEATREGQEDMVHEFINDLFAPGNARLHLGMPVKEIA